MKKLLLLPLLTAFCLNTNAQTLPQPSPGGSVEQTVGLTEVSINYSRPGVKERKIFGELVPFGKLWRTGANANTTVEFSTEVVFGGTSVKAGKYSVFTIPNAKSWEVILNSKTDMYGTGDYNKSLDVARIEVPVNKCEMTESFTIEVADIHATGAKIVLRWEQTSIAIPITVEVEKRAKKNIEDAIANSEQDKLWRVYRNAANFYLNNKMDMNQALSYMKQSIQLNDESWYSHWVMARILAENSMYKKAVDSGEKAIEVGAADAKAKNKDFAYKEMISESIEKWKNQSKS